MSKVLDFNRKETASDAGSQDIVIDAPAEALEIAEELDSFIKVLPIDQAYKNWLADRITDYVRATLLGVIAQAYDEGMKRGRNHPEGE